MTKHNAKKQSKQPKRPAPTSFKIIVEKHADGYVAYPLGLKGVVVGEGNSYEQNHLDGLLKREPPTKSMHQRGHLFAYGSGQRCQTAIWLLPTRANDQPMLDDHRQKL